MTTSFDESAHPRSADGRFTTRRAAPPAAALGAIPPGSGRPPAAARRPRGVRTGVVRRSLVLLSAQEETTRVRKDQEAVGRREKALRRALVERELERAGAATARVGVGTAPDRVVVASVQARPGRTVDEDALAAALARAARPLDGSDRPGTGQDGWQRLDEALGGPGRTWSTVTGRDRVDQARADHERASARLRANASRAVTALCLEAERQGARRLDVEDGAVRVAATGRLLAVEDGTPADLGDALPPGCVRDLPGVSVCEEDPSCWSVDVDRHLGSQDLQVPGQTYLRV